MFMSPAVFTFSLVSMVCSLFCLIILFGSVFQAIKESKKKYKKEFVNGSYKKLRK